MGYYFCPKLKALIYRYMEKGSLYAWIHSVNIIILFFMFYFHIVMLISIFLKTSMSVIKDVFRVLVYLHARSPPVIHQDIKSLVHLQLL